MLLALIFLTFSGWGREVQSTVVVDDVWLCLMRGWGVMVSDNDTSHGVVLY